MPARLEEEHSALELVSRAECDDETRARQMGSERSEDAEVFRIKLLTFVQASLRRHATDEEGLGLLSPSPDEEGASRR